MQKDLKGPENKMPLRKENTASTSTCRDTNPPRIYFLKRILLLFIELLIVDNLNTNMFVVVVFVFYGS